MGLREFTGRRPAKTTPRPRSPRRQRAGLSEHGQGLAVDHDVLPRPDGFHDATGNLQAPARVAAMNEGRLVIDSEARLGQPDPESEHTVVDEREGLAMRDTED